MRVSAVQRRSSCGALILLAAATVAMAQQPFPQPVPAVPQPAPAQPVPVPAPPGFPPASPFVPSGPSPSADFDSLPADSFDDFDVDSAQSSSLGATRGSYSSAPNLIGDLFNSGTASLNFSADISVVPDFVTTPSFASSADLINGIDVGITGVSVTSLSDIGDLVTVGDSTFIGVSDLQPINSFRVQTNDSAAQVGDALAFGDTVSAASPVAISDIFTAANNAIADEFSSEFSGDVEVQELVTVEYLEDQSELELVSGGPNQVVSANYVYRIAARLPVPSPGEVVGRYSIADNNSPLPQDRLFLDYNFFHNARITPVGIPVNRWAPGFEKTFWGRNASFELRVPMAATLSSDISTEGGGLAGFELGDIALATKLLLYENNFFALSCGLGITLPTADDFVLRLENNEPVTRIENRSVHLLPYMAFMVLPTPNTFIQSFSQIDVDTNGNDVFLDEQAFRLQGGTGLELAGRLRSQTLLRSSLSAGKFLFRNRCRGRVRQLAAVLESHYTATLNRSDSVGSDNFSIGDPSQVLNVLNLTCGLHAYVGKSVLTAAYGVPVTSDRVFDGELRVFANRYF